jgi:hypothetical protein
VKLAGQNNGNDFQPTFNTILTKDLLLAVLRGEVPDTTALDQWLQTHASPTL